MMKQKIVISHLLTEQELAIIQFIHEFGFCDIHHIMRRFNIKRTVCYEKMRSLMRFGLLNFKVVLPHFPGVYFLTIKAVRLINADLSLLTYVPLNNYSHYMEVLKVYLKLHDKYPDSTWKTERRLIKQKHEDMVGNKEHIPDGILILSDGKHIAIEVELSLKSRERLLGILTDYVVDRSVYEVWYFCLPQVFTVVNSMAVTLPKIKTFFLNEK